MLLRVRVGVGMTGDRGISQGRRLVGLLHLDHHSLG